MAWNRKRGAKCEAKAKGRPRWAASSALYRLEPSNQIGTSSRGTQSCNFYVVKHTDMPATLVEVAFISNPTEEKLMNSEDGVQKAAQGIADGIADFFG